MASQGNPNGGDDQKDTGWSQPLTVETSLSSFSNPPGDSLLQMSPPLPILPFHLITEEILWRLPVKFLMTLKCVCKSWNSLISSDHKFAMKQLRISRINSKLILNFKKHKQSPEFSHMVYPLSSFFNNGTINHGGTGINFPLNSYTNIVASCDGILCLTQKMSRLITQNSVQVALWNPSTRKYNLLPNLYKQQVNYGYVETVFGFGYDHFTHNYKVVVVFMYKCKDDRGYSVVYKTQVMVHTSGTDSWRFIQDFPSVIFGSTSLHSGKFVSGTINWLVPIGDKPIVSLDLGTESYQQILPPAYGEEKRTLKMGVSRDCLCIVAGRFGPMISDIWLMKEYGNSESWTKLVTVPSFIKKVLYISEDDQMLLESLKMFEPALVVYDPINGTLKTQDVVNFKDFRLTEIYVESLISPCS